MLIDTNIVLEFLLDQKRVQESEDLLKAIDENIFSEEVYMTQFAINGIQSFDKILNTNFLKYFLVMIYQEKIKIAPLDISDDLTAYGIKKDIGLDFDDAIQFLAASKLGTYIVTYNKDFRKTSLPTKTPAEVLKEILI